MVLAKDSPDYIDDITRKEVADYLYERIASDIAAILEKQKGYEYDNNLIELGAQVAEGDSVFWDAYEATVTKIAQREVEKLPQKFIWALWQNIEHTYTEYIDEDEDDLDDLDFSIYDDIAAEIFDKVCQIAEDAFDEYEAECEENEYDEEFDEEDEDDY